MPLNYSKWDQLELSDDSDIEGHPNVDKKSLIRWKQRDIHEKREARNFRIQSLGAEIDCNEVLLARLRALLADLRSTDASMPPSKRFSNEVERLRMHPSPDAPPSAAQQPVSYDEMILRLLDAVAQESSTQKDKEGGVDAGIIKVLEGHVEKLAGVIEASRKEKEELEAEKRKHITMEDMREGWESKYVPATPAPVIPPPKKKKSTKTKETTIEVLNAPSSSTSATAAAAADEESEDEREPLPEMTGDLEEFSRIPLWDFERSWTFIQNHRSVVAPRSADALTVAAFEREGRGEKKLAKQAVHQSLLLQYGEKLGKDGIKLFFQRMIQGGEKARQVFAHDVEATYAHVEGRIKMTQAEAESAEPAEQIQLVAEHPGVEISFNVPDGPPPEHIVLEGPGTENLDIEEVRKALQLRWDVFEGLAEDMREALKSGELDRVNAVLGAMPVAEAEQVVQMLDVGGILSFAEGGIRDATREDGEGDEGAFQDAVEGASGVVEQVEETKKAAA